MYISALKVWNFRKYGSPDFDLNAPHLTVPFNKGMNILIGENDSGKSAIIDAIKLVLKTHAYEWIKVEESDFFSIGNQISSILRIELEFSGITNAEASNFTEWCGTHDEIINVEGRDETFRRPKLILIYQAGYKDGRILPADVKAGMDGVGNILTAEAKDYLKCTYLKALRDADNELAAKKNSRLSQILKEHKEFKLKQENGLHEFEELFEGTSDQIRDKFKDEGQAYHTNIKKVVDDFIGSFIDESSKSVFDLGPTRINNILEKLSLGIIDAKNLGLGTMNRLFMAAELLHLRKSDWNGLKLCMIEELEAHLHPQAQLKIIKRLKREEGIQYILTSHSPNITSQADLREIIVCKNNKVFPLGEGNTKLDRKDYKYLERFLDVTKSNLFFSKGNIIVEGWSEEILLPTLAIKLGMDLTKKEISIINVASTAYLHFAKIFLREDGEKMNVPVSIITDFDNRPDEFGVFKSLLRENQTFKNKFCNVNALKRELKSTDVKLNIALQWTLEWCLYKSCLSNIFKEAVSRVHNKTEDFKTEDGNFKNSFERKFIKKLSKGEGTSPIDKVAVMNVFAELLEKDITITTEQIAEDNYLSYLLNAIKHVHDYEN
ncbi:AAA family ATPase [Chryseobacterium sediminis]|uniref:ATP-dependent nuclease n=1 Tax=Chryseobacterium sediminis TaxID=1679494 RepID=UPI0028675E06|nr:AAA family ATPase [Chryseobacterium sediminis]MDR6462606.1 putative ATP-dependent endonuclease of OLD family [Chryseobacterium sediminis]